MVDTHSYTCVFEKIGETCCKNACRPPSLLHDLDYRTLILGVDGFDPAFGKSIIHDSLIFDWSGYKNDGDRNSEATTNEESTALFTFA